MINYRFQTYANVLVESLITFMPFHRYYSMYSLYSSLHTTCFSGHGTGTIIGLSSCKRHIDVVLGQTWQSSVCYALTSCIKQRSPFSNSMASASASTPLTVSFSISLDLTGWKNVVIGQAMNAGRRWRGKHCFTSRGEQIVTEGTQKQLHFWISLAFTLVGKCHKRFIKKISQLKSDTRSCRCNNFSLKVVSVRSDRGGGGSGSPGSATAKQFCFHTANKTAFHLQQRSHGLLRCEVSVHLHTCGLSPFNNQGEATTRSESNRTHQSFCLQPLEAFRLRTQPQLLQIWWRPLQTDFWLCHGFSH